MATKAKGRGPVGKLLIGAGAVMVACCGLSALGAVVSPRGTTGERAQGAQREATDAVVAVTPEVTFRVIASPAVVAAPTATAEPTVPPPTATPMPLGSAKDAPAPVGSEVIANEFGIVVTAITRPADEIVARGNMFNTEPEAGQEYVRVTLNVRCVKDASEQCDISPYAFKLYGSEGIVREPENFLAGIDGMLESTEFFGGATLQEKSLFFRVGEGETSLILEFESGLIFRAQAFFALPDKAG